MPDKKWASKVKLKEGALKKMGWPNTGGIVAKVNSGAVPYATAIRRLVYLANVSKNKNPKLAASARAAIVRLQKSHKAKGE